MAIDWDSWAKKSDREKEGEEAYADYTLTAYEDGNDKAGEWLAERGYFDWKNKRGKNRHGE
jgi:hypothetical protein